MVPPAVRIGVMRQKTDQLPPLFSQFVEVMNTVMETRFVFFFITGIGNEVDKLVFPSHVTLLGQTSQIMRVG
jgi:hypothetical protein